MFELDLLQFSKDLIFKKEGNQRFIFDPIRKKYLVIGPEEMVRQLMVQYLIQVKNYNPNRLSIERELRVQERRKRCDLLVFSQAMKPFLLVECKAPEVKLTQAVARQIAVYNLPLQVDYLLITNGLANYCFKMNYEEKSYEFLKEIPDFASLTPDP
ncbi:MAG: hypothetical protein ACI9XO_002568 [Paraglaciecola sp.]|jgi:hypothetical protein